MIGRHVNLRQAGRNYVGLCPFHSEKTPSFTVNPEKRFFYCFGCGAGGSAINFMMRFNNLSFTEAVVQLAEESGIPVPQLSQGESRERELRERLMAINQLAARYYYSMLRAAPGAQARRYLAERGISPVLARTFYLGYAPGGWITYEVLEGQNASLEDAAAAGLISQASGAMLIASGWIIFPICDHLGGSLGRGE